MQVSNYLINSLLGVMYGMSTRTLAISRLQVQESLAQELVDTMMGEFKVLKKYIEDNMAWPERHEGFVKQIYGDTLRSRSWRFAHKSDGSVDKFEMLKVQRHGINWISDIVPLMSNHGKQRV